MCSLLCVVACMSERSRLLYYILDRLIAEVHGSVNLYNCNHPRGLCCVKRIVLFRYVFYQPTQPSVRFCGLNEHFISICWLPSSLFTSEYSSSINVANTGI